MLQAFLGTVPGNVAALACSNHVAARTRNVVLTQQQLAV
jgi:hypothetical protein